MKRPYLIVGFIALLALSQGSAFAQCGEPFDAAATQMLTQGSALGNVWGCPTSGNTGSPFCGITYRFYSPESNADPDSGGLGPVNKGSSSDGNPIYVPNSGGGSYRTDVDNSSNYFGALHPCGRQMYVLWDATLDGNDGSGTPGDHVGYYGVQGQLVEAAEQGNIFLECGGTARFVSCFRALNGSTAANVLGTPQGTLQHTGGMAPIPVPKVDSYNRVTGDIALSWDAPNNYRQTETAPNPITGVELYLLEDTGVLDARGATPTDLDSGARFVRRVDLPSTSTVINDGVDVTAGTGSFIPVLKVVYTNNAFDPEPMRTTNFSANGSVVLIDTALLTEVTDFAARSLGRTRGVASFAVSWNTTVEDGLQGFVLERAESLEGPYAAVTGLIPPRGLGDEGASYEVTDSFRPRNAREFFYRLQIHETGDQVSSHGPIRAELVSGNREHTPKADELRMIRR